MKTAREAAQQQKQEKAAEKSAATPLPPQAPADEVAQLRARLAELEAAARKS
jgi:hypothetical protein